MTGTLVADDALLDDPSALAAADHGGMLLACASAGAQVRAALRTSAEAGLAAVAAEGRPRSLVVAGVGGSGTAGSVLAAATGTRCPVPVVGVRDVVLPGWVGPLDLVVAVSCSGRTEETLLVVEEAARRGCRLVTVGAAGSPLHRYGEQARARHVPVDAGGRLPRANLWALSVPLLVLADALGLATVPEADLLATADALDATATALAPSVPLGENPAKDLALALAGRLPLVWGASSVASAAAYRLVGQLAENAKLPAVLGDVPEVGHNQVVAFDGPYAGGAVDDVFRDPFDDPAGISLRPVLLRADDEHPRVAVRAGALQAVAEQRGIATTVLRATGASPVQQLASLVALGDFASTYLALATGVDPTPIPAIDELKARTALDAR
ncbi:glucose/mannose-6-phosphate isomerase [Motilibacter rhizosphaerae]|uniref:Glucose/mannose-6-phosphate isomerase n=1 Tax=Motilibacter rhizosphaerae TaxID=598652 RepID=A0A4Q7NSS5_9ACTN|nr:SIS domain-containing protein [Motilibacter rhizosphaerae]RZS90157.1 glucose/mannose-6-phosphate isomerase [Motilibacter rhizosphaerae]